MKYLNKLKEVFIIKFGSSGTRKNDEFRHILMDQYHDSESYLQLHKKCQVCHSVKTDLNISSTINFQFETSLRDIKKKLSVTKTDVINNYSLNTKILYFKIIQNNCKTKCQLHFFNNKLFMCGYTYSYLDKEERLEMIKNIQAKYISTPTNSLQQNIVDEFKNFVLFNNTVDLTINYLALNSEFFITLKKNSHLQK